MTHLFLTGEKQVGKSTLIQKWLSCLHVTTAGFYTKKYPSSDGQLNVHILSTSKPEKPDSHNILFACNCPDPYDSTERFDRLGCRLLSDAGKADLIIMDEIGIMEENAAQFKASVLSTLDGNTPVLGVVRKVSRDCQTGSFIRIITSRSDVHVIEVTHDNRDQLGASLPEELSMLTTS